MKNTTKLLSGFISASLLICSFSACGTVEPVADNTSITSSAASEISGAETSTETSAPTQTAKPANTLSKPVALTANGDIDMTVSLAYETDFDALMTQLNNKAVSEDHPVSENTNPETLELYRWLKSIYGKQVISAQSLGGPADTDNKTYYYYTEDLPAMKGFDFIFKTTPEGDGADWTQMAIDWHTKSGGIVCFCWHWNVPRDINDPSNNYEAFYRLSDSKPDGTTFSIKNAVTPGTKEYEVAVHDIDLVAYELQRLETAGVPVLWRPLHEASGSWFWWGVNDKEDVEGQYYQKLWYMIYDRLENYHKLTNLIWVWNGQSKHTIVHENTYDIAGIDVYPNSEDHSVLEASYKKLADITADGKMLALTECGYIPDPDELAANLNEVKWLYYMPWNSSGKDDDGAFIYKRVSAFGVPVINEKRNSEELMKKAMTSDTIITWSELPEFEGSTHELPDTIKIAIADFEFQHERDAAKTAKEEKE